jgi:hypothetical protein
MQQLGGLHTYMEMHVLFALNLKLKFFFSLFIFSHGNKPMYFFCNDFVRAKHGLHHLNCDFVLKLKQFMYKTKF